MLGEQVMNTLKRNDPEAYLAMDREFERIKRKADILKENIITFRFPIAVLETYENINGENWLDIIKISNYNNSITVTKDRILIGSSLFQTFFEPTITQIIFELEKLFNNYGHAGNLTDVILVGGFTECVLVQNALQHKFSNKHFIIPKGAEVAVIEGSVLCGHQPYQESIIPPLQVCIDILFYEKCNLAKSCTRKA